MKRLVVWIGMVLLVPSLVWAGEANAKIGKLVERMRVGPLKRLDIGGTRPLSRCLRLLYPGGTYVLAGGPRGRWAGPLAPVFKLLVSKPFVAPRLCNNVLHNLQPKKKEQKKWDKKQELY